MFNEIILGKFSEGFNFGNSNISKKEYDDHFKNIQKKMKKYTKENYKVYVNNTLELQLQKNGNKKVISKLYHDIDIDSNYIISKYIETEHDIRNFPIIDKYHNVYYRNIKKFIYENVSFLSSTKKVDIFFIEDIYPEKNIIRSIVIRFPYENDKMTESIIYSIINLFC